MSMTTTFKPYKRRDGSLMLYINRSNGVSVGLSPERDFAPYGKGVTPGQRNAYDAACAAISANGEAFTGNLDQHAEGGLCAPVRLANGWTMVGTDVASIGGHPTGADGHFLVVPQREGPALIVPMGQPLEEELETIAA